MGYAFSGVDGTSEKFGAICGIFVIIAIAFFVAYFIRYIVIRGTGHGEQIEEKVHA